MKKNIRHIMTIAAGMVAISAAPSFAEKKYGPGVTDTEIKIGNTNPYSGPASAYGAIGKAMTAYFQMINDNGGINGRKINFITYDDSYSPPKTVEQARKLVESDEVSFIFSPLGTAANSAIQKYMNVKKVPQLFISSAATKWGDPANFPWSMGWAPSYQSEGRVYAKYIIDNHPNEKIAIFYQNDDLGKDLIVGLKDGLGAKASQIVAEAPYEVSEPTIDSQIVKLKSSGATLLVNIATPKFAAQAIRKIAELGWKPVHIMANVSASVGAVLKPAGLDNSTGIVSSSYLKDATNPAMADDPGYKAWKAYADKYNPQADPTFSSYAYTVSQGIVQVLKQCGDDLTRENIMAQAANLKGLKLDMLLPGITVNTSATDFFPIDQLQIIKFDGTQWAFSGPIIEGKASAVK